MNWYIPHLDLIGSTIISVGILGILMLFHRSRDRMMEYKFLTREDFRRIESKIDALLNVAIQVPYLTDAQRKAIAPKRLDSHAKL